MDIATTPGKAGIVHGPAQVGLRPMHVIKSRALFFIVQVPGPAHGLVDVTARQRCIKACVQGSCAVAALSLVHELSELPGEALQIQRLNLPWPAPQER